MRTYSALLGGVALWLGGVASAHAYDMTLGHVAPGLDPVQIFINDEPVGPVLHYLEFAQVTGIEGDLRVEARSTIDGGSIARALMSLDPGEIVKPMLVVTGNGSTHERELRLYQGDARYVPGVNPNESAFGAHDLAPYAVQPDAPRATSTLQCQARNTAFSGGWGGVSTQGSYGYSTINTFRLLGVEATCTLQIAHPVIGNFVVVAQVPSGHTVRAIVVGDGVLAPFAVVVVDDGAVVNAFQTATPTPGAVTFSEDIWYDVTRPAQSVTLYEQAGADAMSGFWVTHDAAGKPVWYFMDGVRTALPGQRDIALHRFSSDASKPPSSDAGTARLFYLDCNQAELRILSGEREFHTLRLRRSREVPGCELFD
jgi:hypothetical protein